MNILSKIKSFFTDESGKVKKAIIVILVIVIILVILALVFKFVVIPFIESLFIYLREPAPAPTELNAILASGIYKY